MSDAELLEHLGELALAAGLTVRTHRDRAGGEAERRAGSGVCRVRGEIWIVLAADDPLVERIEVLAGALRAHAADYLESRYLPPAVRERLRSGDDLA